MNTISLGEAEARIRLSGFTILVHETEEGETGYWGEVVELPGCVSQGETLAELKVQMKEAMEAILHQSIADAPDASFSSWSSTPTVTVGTGSS